MMGNTTLPSQRGSYLLVFNLEKHCTLQIGKLGLFNFPTGIYVYCGSAFGSGGLRARLGHHLNFPSSLLWHVDYLRPHFELMEIMYLLNGERLECRWSQFFLLQPFAFVVAPRFGASDCQQGCLAHLIGFPIELFPEILRNFSLAWDCQRLPIR